MAHIIATPGTCRGRPRIAGTRVTVARVDRLVNEEGCSPAEAAATLEVPLADVYRALAYAAAHGTAPGRGPAD